MRLRAEDADASALEALVQLHLSLLTACVSASEGFGQELDKEATPAAREAWLKASEKHWHNPSSLYRDAGLASQQLESARERLGTLIGAEAERIEIGRAHV